MLGTRTVRDIMHRHGNTSIWTNKRAGGDGRLRSVKCYHYGAESCDQLVEELQKKAGEMNVRVTDGEQAPSSGYGLGSIIVTCILE